MCRSIAVTRAAEARLAESYKQDLYEQNVKMLSCSRHGTTKHIVKKVAQ